MFRSVAISGPLTVSSVPEVIMFRSVAISVSSVQEYGGIYAFRFDISVTAK